MVRWRNPAKTFALGATLLVIASVGASDLFAQDKNKKAADKSPPIHWVKMCDVANVRTDKAGKIENKRICLTHYERFIRETGQVLLSVAVREVEGLKDRRLLILVPLGMSIPTGVAFAIDQKKPVKLDYSVCHAGGCVAELEVTPQLIGELTAGKELKIGVLDMAGQKRGFRVPLNGFGDRLNGSAVDAKIYMAERRRQIELARKAYAEAKKKETAKGKAAPGPKKN